MESDTPPFERYPRIARLLRGKHVEWVLAFVSFIESCFMPIVIEPFMVPPIIAAPRKWFRLTTIVVVFSALGGIAGYLIGLFFFEIIGAKLISLYGGERYLESTAQMVDDNVFWVIFAGAFTPLPYKVFTVIAGFLHANFWMFLLGTLVGRGLRFYIVGYLVSRFGERALSVLVQNANLAVVASILFVVLYAFVAFF